MVVVAMSEGAGMDNQAGTGEERDLDVQQAALIVEQARAKAQQELRTTHPAIYLTWAGVYLIGYGAIWLSVRGQHPYRAPAPYAILGVFLLAGVALAVTATLVGRATSGVGGGSDVRRRITYMTLAVGYLGVLVLEAALDNAGASQRALGVYGAAAPILLIGLVISGGAGSQMNWIGSGLGLWLIAAAALSGFAGPAGVWGVLALAVGGGFAAMGVITMRKIRS
jgi:hypothetical protein